MFVKVVFTTVEAFEAHVGLFKCGESFKTSFLPPWTLLMLVKASLSTVKVFKHRYIHRGSLLKLMPASLSTVKVCKGSFHHSGSLLNFPPQLNRPT